MEGTILECGYCGDLVLGKTLFAHIVKRHNIIPHPSDVPPSLYPRAAGIRRLQPVVERIVHKWVEDCRTEQAREAARQYASLRKRVDDLLKPYSTRK